MAIQIPDDEMVKSVPFYMEEESDDEEGKESNSPTSTDHTLDTQAQPATNYCPVCNSRQYSEASKKSTEHQPIDQQSSGGTDNIPSLTNFSNPDRDIQSVGESTDMVSSDTQCTCMCRLSATVGCSGQAGSSLQCELPKKSSRLCEHLNGRLAPVPLQDEADTEPEKNPNSGCKFRRKSDSDVLDENGMALFNILDLPSKVGMIPYSCKFSSVSPPALVVETFIHNFFYLVLMIA